MKNLQVACMANALIWMSAVDSSTSIPGIIAVASMGVALVLEKRKSTIRLAAKNRAKTKNLTNVS